MNSLVKISIRITIGLGLIIAVFYLLFRNIDFGQAISSLEKLSWVFFIETFVLAMAIPLVQTWRFMLLCNRSKLEISYWQAFKIFFSSQAATPLPGGEVMRGWLLNLETGGDPIKVSGPVAAQAFMEIISALAIVVVGSLFYRVLVAATVLVCALLAAVVIILFKPDWIKQCAKLAGRWPRLKNYVLNVSKAQEEILKILFGKERHVNPFFLSVFGISVAAHICGGLLIYCTGLALGAAVPLIFSFFLYAVSVVIIGVLAVVPAGVGFTEGGMLGLLRLVGVSFTKSALLILMFRFWTLVFPVVLGAITTVAWYAKPIFLKKNNR